MVPSGREAMVPEMREHVNMGEIDRQTVIAIDRQQAELRWRQLIRRDRARQTERGGTGDFPGGRTLSTC